MTSAEIVGLLGLEPHPEGGFYRQTFADTAVNGRPVSTLIYYLLTDHKSGSWHRVTDAVEIWHWYAGAPLTLAISRDGKLVQDYVLGADLTTGQRPQIVIPANAWQRATCHGDWTLVGCTVAPGFQFSKWEQAADGWVPGA
ncbi:MAG: cupin domain-containing protein [Devosia sp.]